MRLMTYSHAINQFEGTFACSCDFGYEGDGYHCIDHDECEAGDHLCPGPSQESGLHTSIPGLERSNYSEFLNSSESWGIVFK